jgi:hypothetical protein
MNRAITLVFFVMWLLSRPPARSVTGDSPTQDPAVLKATDAYLAAVLASDGAALTFTHTEATVAGNVAYDIGSHKQTQQTTSRGSAGSIDDSGKYVVILKRANGAWRVAHAICNSDRQPGTTPTSASR